eukprot:1398236-Prymnesium_polylepis.1
MSGKACSAHPAACEVGSIARRGGAPAHACERLRLRGGATRGPWMPHGSRPRDRGPDPQLYICWGVHQASLTLPECRDSPQHAIHEA